MKVLTSILALGSLIIAVSAPAFAVETGATCAMVSNRNAPSAPAPAPASDSKESGSSNAGSAKTK